MKITTTNNNLYTNKPNNYPANKNTAPNFTGLGIRLPQTARKIKKLEWEKDLISSLLQIPTKEVTNLTRNASEEKVLFLKTLAKRYNAKYFYERENSEDIAPIINIFKTVKKANGSHYEVLNRFSLPFEKLDKIYTLAAKEDPKLLKKVVKFYDEVFSGVRLNSKSDIVFDILSSKHGKSIIKEPDKYRSYILLNHKNENFIENLTKEIDNQTFDAAKYDRKYDITSLFSNEMLAKTDVLNPENLAKTYSKEGGDLLRTFFKSSNLSHQAMLDGNDADILKIYESTNAKNFKIRNSFIKNFVKGYTKNITDENKYWDETKYLSALFNKLDKDKDVKTFVNNLIKDEHPLASIKDLYNVVENIPAKKLNRFYSNFINIEEQVSPEKLVKTLEEELENPFFQTKTTQRRERGGYREKESGTSKVFRFIKNKINIFIYRNIEKSNPKQESIQVIPVQIPETSVNPKTLILQPKISEQMQPQTQFVQEPPKVALQKTLSKTEAKRLLVAKDVDNVIEKHLTKKMLERQQGTYSENATKMRLNLLPEIFRSISETRKVDRLVGKTYGSSSNYDAVKLYKRINRNNKKVVNYMLKKRNVDGSRMYDVKSIIALLDKSEKRIAVAKKGNPEFKSNEVKAFYNNIYDNMIEQYGKVKPLRSFKSTEKV